MKCSFFLAAIVSILLYGSTTWTLTKRLEKARRELHKNAASNIGGNTPQSPNYSATYVQLRKLSKLDKPDTQDTAREAGTSS